jgi:ubiquinone/menaquinone biosynthesis C-methylase UbiE
MPAETQTASNTADFYDEEYYQGQYGAVINDELNYRLLSLYWRELLFVRNQLNPDGKVLDFGSGVGQVSAALPNSVCIDFNPFALAELRKRGRALIDNRKNIPPSEFDCVLSSHSLEHSPSPFQDLQDFRGFLRPGGRLVLVLPIEVPGKPTLRGDWNQHLQAWTFQTITNLLLAAGWTPEIQRTIYSPYLLRTLGRRVSAEVAVQYAMLFGRLTRSTPCMLTVARPAS